jgi:serine/threonine protein kinase
MADGGLGGSLGSVLSSDVVVGERYRVDGCLVVYRGKCREKDVMLSVVEKKIDKGLVEDLKKFIRLVERLRHPNVLLYMGYTNINGYFALLTEVVDRNFEDFLLNSSMEITLPDRLRWGRDCAFGLNWLHSCEPPVVHCDLQPRHFYLNNLNHVKMWDFGFSKEMNNV